MLVICMLLVWPTPATMGPAAMTEFALADTSLDCQVVAEIWPTGSALAAYVLLEPSEATRRRICGPSLRDCPDYRRRK